MLEFLPSFLINVWDSALTPVFHTFLFDCDHDRALALQVLLPWEDWKMGLNLFSGPRQSTCKILSMGLGHPVHSRTGQILIKLAIRTKLNIETKFPFHKGSLCILFFYDCDFFNSQIASWDNPLFGVPLRPPRRWRLNIKAVTIWQLATTVAIQLNEWLSIMYINLITGFHIVVVCADPLRSRASSRSWWRDSRSQFSQVPLSFFLPGSFIFYFYPGTFIFYPAAASFPGYLKTLSPDTCTLHSQWPRRGQNSK